MERAAHLGGDEGLLAVRGERHPAGPGADLETAEYLARAGVQDRHVVARLPGDVDLPSRRRHADPLGFRSHPRGEDLALRSDLHRRRGRGRLVGDVEHLAVAAQRDLLRIPAHRHLADHLAGVDVDQRHRVLVSERHVDRLAVEARAHPAGPLADGDDRDLCVVFGGEDAYVVASLVADEDEIGAGCERNETGEKGSRGKESHCAAVARWGLPGSRR